MVTVFWDRNGVILTQYTSRGNTINTNTNCQVLQDLHIAIWCKQSGQQRKFILLLHDNTRAYSMIKMQTSCNSSTGKYSSSPHTVRTLPLVITICS